MSQNSKLCKRLFWFAVAAVLVGQLALCHEALVCRGDPPLTVAGLMKQLASPFLVALPAVFGSRANRMRGLIVLSLWVTCLFVMISINGTMRPSIGHLAGISGILKLHAVEIAIFTLAYAPLAFGLLFFIERVSGDLWRAMWLLPSPHIPFADVWREAWGVRPAIESSASCRSI